MALVFLLLQGTPAMLRVLMSTYRHVQQASGSKQAKLLLDPNLATEKGKRTPLYMAVSCGHREMVREMMRFPAIRVDEGKKEGENAKIIHSKKIRYTPLHAAVEKLQHGCVEELLKSKHVGPVLKDQTPKEGHTALMLAAREPKDEGRILKMLLDSGEVRQKQEAHTIICFLLQYLLAITLCHHR